MNRREKEEYLREYEVLKKQGKPFFPYATYKDAWMMLIVFLAVASMTLALGAELGPKADPTTTTYIPRPDWYFFFLFELLIIIKPPELVPVAAIGIPTICMALLLLLPFYDRGPERHPLRRPIATTAGILVIVAMAYLTVLGSGGEFHIEEGLAAVETEQVERGRQVANTSGCQACHKFGGEGGTIGIPLDGVGSKLPPEAIRRTLINPNAPMPSYRQMAEEDPDKFEDLVAFLSQLKE